MREAKSTAVRILKAGAKLSIVYEAIRDEDGNPTVTRKDIANLSLKINSFKETASMEALIIGMEERGYTVHHENHKEKVVLIDATYKTNVYKLPFVNFVDVSNLGQKSILLDKLDDVLSILVDKLSDIKVPEGIKGKGRPSGTKRLPTAL
ncbi:16361_t:CDS:2, partial [Racocetra fulgida]